MTKPRARALARELRAARVAAELTQADVGEPMGWSKYRMSRMESAQTTPAERDVATILDIVGVHGRDRERLLKLARDVDQRTWWESGIDKTGHLSALVDAEQHATRITQAIVNLIPGLLQTRAYSRAVIDNDPDASESKTEQQVNVRQMRQGVLTQPDPVAFVVYLDEACLARSVGGSAVMLEQLDELQRVAEIRDNISLRLVPFDVGAYRGMDGGFTLIDFVRDDTLVYVEQMHTSLMLSEPDDVEPFFSAAEGLHDIALNQDRSLELIARYRKYYEQGKREGYS